MQEAGSGGNTLMPAPFLSFGLFGRTFRQQAQLAAVFKEVASTRKLLQDMQLQMRALQTETKQVQQQMLALQAGTNANLVAILAALDSSD